MKNRMLIVLALLLVAAFVVSGVVTRSQAQGTAATPAATSTGNTLYNLNTGTSEQYLTIPNMNARMVREFMEYRPYDSILQFRKEIGKYVDASQVAEWEKSVFVPIQVDQADVATLKQIPGVTDQIANELIAARPYNTNDAFLAKLATYLPADQITFAKNLLSGTDTPSAVSPVPASSATAITTMAATPAATVSAAAQTFSLFNLNTGTSEQYLTIPNMNARMVREFMEYRPYDSILQFRKEIGKYVDAAQVSEWEKSVFVPIQIDQADAATLKQIPGVTDQIANDLIAARPYNTNDAFLAKLGTYLSADQVSFAKNYLEAK